MPGFTIRPYRTIEGWFFTDPAMAIIHEPLVGGTDDLLDMIVDRYGPIHSVRFSDEPPPEWFGNVGHEHTAVIVHPGDAPVGGTWYRTAWPKRWTFWLCNVLTRYFPQPPRTIWFRVICLGRFCRVDGKALAVPGTDLCAQHGGRFQREDVLRRYLCNLTDRPTVIGAVAEIKRWKSLALRGSE